MRDFERHDWRLTKSNSTPSTTWGAADRKRIVLILISPCRARLLWRQKISLSTINLLSSRRYRRQSRRVNYYSGCDICELRSLADRDPAARQRRRWIADADLRCGLHRVVVGGAPLRFVCFSTLRCSTCLRPRRQVAAEAKAGNVTARNEPTTTSYWRRIRHHHHPSSAIAS